VAHDLTPPVAPSGAGAGAGAAAERLVGVGTDVVDIARMRRVLERTPSFRRRVFTEREQALCDGRRDPVPAYAARFAAKEAVLKSLGEGLGAADMAEIEVVRLPSGAPELALTGRAAELAASHGVTRWAVTLSHSDASAVATAIALAAL
jgi:holo-[acyl-carrier protein] synthase